MKLLDKLRDFLLSLIFDAREFAPRYDLSVYELIERVEKRMIIKDPICPFCKTIMLYRRSNLHGQTPMREDIAYKCPNCKHTCHFGIPISKAEFEEEYALRKGNLLMTPTYRLSERSDKQVIARLKALGYLA